jgi:hypothetical protein
MNRQLSLTLISSLMPVILNRKISRKDEEEVFVIAPLHPSISHLFSIPYSHSVSRGQFPDSGGIYSMFFKVLSVL